MMWKGERKKERGRRTKKEKESGGACDTQTDE